MKNAHGTETPPGAYQLADASGGVIRLVQQPSVNGQCSVTPPEAHPPADACRWQGRNSGATAIKACQTASDAETPPVVQQFAEVTLWDPECPCNNRH